MHMGLPIKNGSFMSERYEFSTTKWQYFFNSTINTIEMSLLTVLGAVVVNSVFGLFGDNEIMSFNRIFLSALFVSIFMLLFILGRYWISTNLLKYELPNLVIDDDGIVLNDFNEKKEFTWEEITKITVKGVFKKVIRLNKNSKSTIYAFDYYLFEPEQREKILHILSSRVDGGSFP